MKFIFLGPILLLASCAQDRSEAPLNFVVILADDLGMGDLGFLGGEMATPNLDTLAQQGMVFDRFYGWPLCSPSRAALLTGEDPMDMNLGLRPLRPEATVGIPAGIPTVAARLQEAGWATACIGKWHLGHAEEFQRPNQQGFQHFYGCLQGAVDYESHRARDGALDWWRNEDPVLEAGYATQLLAAEAVTYLQNLAPDQPFFLYLPFTAPHLPLQAPVEAIRRHMDIADPARRVYCAMVEELDAAVGRVLQALEARGVAENTMVLFLSDNGARAEDGGSNGKLRGGKGTVFEGGLRVPCLLRWPGRVQAGSRESRPQQIGNVTPTILQAAGLLPSDSPVPLLGPSAAPFRFVASNDVWESEAWIDGDRKTIHRRRNADGFEKELIFNLANDPNETRNLAD